MKTFVGDWASEEGSSEKKYTVSEDTDNESNRLEEVFILENNDNGPEWNLFPQPTSVDLNEPTGDRSEGSSKINVPGSDISIPCPVPDCCQELFGFKNFEKHVLSHVQKKVNLR